MNEQWIQMEENMFLSEIGKEFIFYDGDHSGYIDPVHIPTIF